MHADILADFIQSYNNLPNNHILPIFQTKGIYVTSFFFLVSIVDLSRFAYIPRYDA